MKKLLIILKWKYLRWLVEYNRVGFNKCMLRMYYIQELKKLPQYDQDKLAWLNYYKLKKLFINEFPNIDPGNPYTND